MNMHQFKQSVQFFNDMHDKYGNPTEMWSENTKRNLPRIHRDRSIWRFEGLLEGEKEKAVVLIGASPSLKENIEKLKALDDNFITIVANSALKFLLENGIKPDYVIAIDGDKGNLVGHLDYYLGQTGDLERHLNCDNDDLTLISSNATAPEAVDVWKGDVYWLPYYAIDKDLKKKVRRRLGKTVPCGGNTMTTAAAMAYMVFGARTIIFVGNEYCYDEQYYVDKDSKWEDPRIMHFKVFDSRGRKRYTNIPLHCYAQWLEKMAIDGYDCNMIDTSFGILGTNDSKIIAMDLSEAIEKVKESFRKKELAKTDWRAREQLRYNAAYQTGDYLADNGRLIWNQIFDIYDLSKIKTVLDVGCGLGAGVAMCRNEGIEAYGIDIAEPAREYWDMANISQFCQIASADEMPFPDNRFDFVICTEVMEHIPEEGVLDVLKEIYRVGRNTFVLTICLKPAVYKMPHDGSEPHICIKSVEWWYKKIEEAGFNVILPTLARSQVNLIIIAMKGENDEGILSSNDMFLQPKRTMHSPGDQLKVPGSVRHTG